MLSIGTNHLSRGVCAISAPQCFSSGRTAVRDLLFLSARPSFVFALVGALLAAPAPHSSSRLSPPSRPRWSFLSSPDALYRNEESLPLVGTTKLSSFRTERSDARNPSFYCCSTRNRYLLGVVLPSPGGFHRGEESLPSPPSFRVPVSFIGARNPSPLSGQRSCRHSERSAAM
jgi:hypothetical protein